MLAEYFTFDTLVRTVLHHGPKLLALVRREADATSQLLAKLDEISHKLDRITLRRMHSAFAIVGQVDEIASAAMTIRLLDSAERSLLEYIALDPKSMTGGKPNTYWTARAYLGLSAVALRRAEGIDAARWVLKAFVSDPREVRTALAPDVYSELFQPHMGDLFAQHSKDMEDVPAANVRRAQLQASIMRNAAGHAASHVVDTLATAVFPFAVVLGGIARNVNGSRVARMTQELEQLTSEAKVDDKLQSSIDARCREIAQHKLSQ